MSERFNGFSQDEIKKVCGDQNQKKNTASMKPMFRGPHGEGIRRMTDKMVTKTIAKKQQQQQSERSEQPNLTAAKSDAGVSNATSNETLEEISLDRSMSKSIEEALFFQPKRITTAELTNPKDKLEVAFDKQKDTKVNESSILHLPDSDVPASTNKMNEFVTLDDSSILPTSKNGKGDNDGDHTLNLDSPFKGISLKDFETHRKMIEEQNKQKKEMLYKAIEQYSQKTAAEARKIEEIKSELSKLDNDLALDVAILRKQIDMACLNFSNIEKQYMKIESQFLRAKIDLHNAAEKKELLTEHLCTVIAHNEDRKAQKLSELMQKVGLTSAGDFEAKATQATDEAEKK